MKGQSWIQDWFVILIEGALVVTIPLLLPAQTTKISPEVEAKEFENKAILLTNSMLADADLIYSNNRGMFDVNSLNDNFYEDSFGTALYTCKPNLLNCKLPTFPETFALIIIVDSDTGKGWFTGTHRLTGSEPRVTNIVSCFQDRWSTNYPQLFQANSDIGKVLELEKCSLQRHSNILNEQGFPASIRYPTGTIHMGWIKVMVVE